MAFLKSLALGAISAISVPFVLRDRAGLLGEAVRYGTVTPDAGTFAFPFSIPVFAGVVVLAYVLFRASDA